MNGNGGLVFRGFQPQSFSDYRGRLAAVLFTGGCNLRCRFCYNAPLVLAPDDQRPIAESEALDLLRPRVRFLEAVVISGGEPTIHEGALLPFLAELKAFGFLVGLDTNGTDPATVRRALDGRLVDRLAVDYKAPAEGYGAVTGRGDVAGAVAETLRLAASAGGAIEHEVRLTLHPALHSAADIATMARELEAAGVRCVALQTFKPWDVLDRTLQDGPSYSREDLERFARGFPGTAVVR